MLGPTGFAVKVQVVEASSSCAMISHAYKCIFIHIPGCAGTSIEAWLCGQDWWNIEPHTKHLIASQARKLYAKWWDSYFKFTVVRNPYSRTQSLLRFGEHFGLAKEANVSIDFSGYEAKFGAEVVIEHDHRFADRDILATVKHRPGRVYGNILDETLDFVGKFENLAAEMAFVKKSVGFPRIFDVHMKRSLVKWDALTLQDRSWVKSAYRMDLNDFGYAFPT